MSMQPNNSKKSALKGKIPAEFKKKKIPNRLPPKSKPYTTLTLNEVQELLANSKDFVFDFSDTHHFQLESDGFFGLDASFSESKEIDLSGNNISKFTAGINLGKLKHLAIDSNGLVDLTFTGLKSLLSLSASRNRIQNINDVSDLGKLVNLDLSYNRIMGGWNQLSKLKSLKVLDLGNCRIDIPPSEFNSLLLIYLKPLTKLQFINLSGNPIEESIPDLRYIMIQELPELKYYNWDLITKEDRLHASKLASTGQLKDYTSGSTSPVHRRPVAKRNTRPGSPHGLNQSSQAILLTDEVAREEELSEDSHDFHIDNDALDELIQNELGLLAEDLLEEEKPLSDQEETHNSNTPIAKISANSEGFGNLFLSSAQQQPPQHKASESDIEDIDSWLESALKEAINIKIPTNSSNEAINSPVFRDSVDFDTKLNQLLANSGLDRANPNIAAQINKLSNSTESMDAITDEEKGKKFLIGRYRRQPPTLKNSTSSNMIGSDTEGGDLQITTPPPEQYLDSPADTNNPELDLMVDFDVEELFPPIITNNNIEINPNSSTTISGSAIDLDIDSLFGDIIQEIGENKPVGQKITESAAPTTPLEKNEQRGKKSVVYHSKEDKQVISEPIPKESMSQKGTNKDNNNGTRLKQPSVKMPHPVQIEEETKPVKDIPHPVATKEKPPSVKMPPPVQAEEETKSSNLKSNTPVTKEEPKSVNPSGLKSNTSITQEPRHPSHVRSHPAVIKEDTKPIHHNPPKEETKPANLPSPRATSPPAKERIPVTHQNNYKEETPTTSKPVNNHPSQKFNNPPTREETKPMNYKEEITNTKPAMNYKEESKPINYVKEEIPNQKPVNIHASQKYNNPPIKDETKPIYHKEEIAITKPVMNSPRTNTPPVKERINQNNYNNQMSHSPSDSSLHNTPIERPVRKNSMENRAYDPPPNNSLVTEANSPIFFNTDFKSQPKADRDFEKTNYPQKTAPPTNDSSMVASPPRDMSPFKQTTRIRKKTLPSKDNSVSPHNTLNMNSDLGDYSTGNYNTGNYNTGNNDKDYYVKSNSDLSHKSMIVGKPTTNSPMREPMASNSSLPRNNNLKQPGPSKVPPKPTAKILSPLVIHCTFLTEEEIDAITNLIDKLIPLLSNSIPHQMKAINILMQLSRKPGRILYIAMNTSLIQSVCGILNLASQIGESELVDVAISAIQELSSHPIMAHQLVLPQYRVLMSLLSLLLSNDPVLVNKAASTLRILSKHNSSIADAMRTAGALPRLLPLLKSNNSDIQTAALNALIAFLESPQNVAKFLQTPGFTDLQLLAKNGAGQHRLHAMEALVYFMSSSERQHIEQQYKDKFFKSISLPHLLIKATGLRSIAKMIELAPDSLYVAEQNLLVKESIHILSSEPTEELLIPAFTLLHNLFFSVKGKQSDLFELFYRLDGIGVIIAYFISPVDNIRLLSLNILSILQEDEDIRKTFIEMGGIASLTPSLNHWDKRIRLKAIHCLQHLIPYISIDQFIHSDIIPSVSSILGYIFDSEELAIAVNIINKITQIKDEHNMNTIFKIIRENAVGESLIRILNDPDQIATDALAEATIGALVTLSFNDDFKHLLLQDENFEILKKILTYNSPSIQERCIRVLSNLASTDYGCYLIATTILLEILNSLTSDTKVNSALRVILTVAMKPQYRALFLYHDPDFSKLKSLLYHPDSTIQSVAQKLLQKLTTTM